MDSFKVKLDQHSRYEKQAEDVLNGKIHYTPAKKSKYSCNAPTSLINLEETQIMSKSTEELVILGLISQMTEEQQTKINACHAEISKVLEKYEDEGLLGLTLCALDKAKETQSK